MRSKNYILNKIQSNTRSTNELPEIPMFYKLEEKKPAFIEGIKANKGYVLTKNDLLDWIETKNFKKILNLVKGLENLSTVSIPKDPHELKDLDVAIIEGQFGVSENGAIWLTDENLGLRALPFITENLVIFLKDDALVSNMHVAYEKIANQHTGFGIFIAGPSKTADIEQSLVIGAHGAKSLFVVFE